MRPNLLTSIPQEEKKPSYDFRKWAAVTGGNEGFEKKAYLDTKGILTIGYGFNLEEPIIRKKLLSRGFDVDGMIKGKVSMTEAQALPILEEIYKESFDVAKKKFTNFDTFPDDVKHVVTDMVFNMGENRFDGFKKMKTALSKNDYAEAARQIADSSYAKQVGNRVNRNIDYLKGSIENASNVKPYIAERVEPVTMTAPMREATSVSLSSPQPEVKPQMSSDYPTEMVEPRMDSRDAYVWGPSGKMPVQDFVDQYGEKVFESTFKSPVPKFANGGLTLPYWKDLDKQYYINSDRTPREYKSGGWTDLDRRYGYYGQYPGYAYGSHVVHGGPTWPEYAMGLDSGATLKQTLDVLKGNPTPKILDTSAQGNMPKKAEYPSYYSQGVKKYSLPEEGRSLYGDGGSLTDEYRRVRSTVPRVSYNAPSNMYTGPTTQRGITFENGGPTGKNKKVYTNLNEFNKAKQAYQDSMDNYLNDKYRYESTPNYTINDASPYDEIVRLADENERVYGVRTPGYSPKPKVEVIFNPLKMMQSRGGVFENYTSQPAQLAPNTYPTQMVAPTVDEIMMPSGQMISRKEFIKQYGEPAWNKATNQGSYKKEDGGWLDSYGKGGMIKRADGSYSRRGLWDNIRANRGSGKKPTKEMLKQERKIRAAEKKADGSFVGIEPMTNLNIAEPRYNKTPDKAVMPVVYANEPNTPDWSKGAKFADGGPTGTDSGNLAVRPMTYDTPNRFNIPLVAWGSDDSIDRSLINLAGYEREGFGKKSAPFVDINLTHGDPASNKYNYSYYDNYSPDKTVVDEKPPAYNLTVNAGIKPEFVLGRKSYTPKGREKLDSMLSISPYGYARMDTGVLGKFPFANNGSQESYSYLLDNPQYTVTKPNDAILSSPTYFHVNPGIGVEVAKHVDRGGAWPQKYSGSFEYNTRKGPQVGLKAQFDSEQANAGTRFGINYSPKTGIGGGLEGYFNIGQFYEKMRRKKTPPQNTINPRYKNGGEINKNNWLDNL